LAPQTRSGTVLFRELHRKKARRAVNYLTQSKEGAAKILAQFQARTY